jgi:hypothetical protein
MAKYIGNLPDIIINGVNPDASGTFNLDLTDLVVAPKQHQHNVEDIFGLQDTLDSKANAIHSHNYVTSVNVNGNSATGNVILNTYGDLAAVSEGNQISLTTTAPSVASTQGITDSSNNVTEIRTFVGTQSEWDAFTPDPSIKYLIYIHQ